MSLNFYFSVKNGKKVQSFRTNSFRRFSKSIGMIKWKICPLVYLRVAYPKEKDEKGKTIRPINDGDYRTKQEFTTALKAFIE